MKLRYSMIALGVLFVPLMGTAVAGGGVDESLFALDLRPAGGPLIYVGYDGTLWEEVNGAKGLQMAKTDYKPYVTKEPDARFSGP